MKYISIPNIKDYQHYKEGRKIIWIKLYLSILNSFKIQQLSDREKWLYISLLLRSALDDNRIALNDTYIRHNCSIKSRQNITKSIKKMARLKLINIKSDSKLIANRYQADSKLIEQKEREKEIDIEKEKEILKKEKNKLLNKFKI